MTNITSDYWDIDGTSLMTYARGLHTLGGSPNGLTQFRGDDTKLALRRGARHRIKVADSRTITLAGWLAGASDDNFTVEFASAAAFWKRWNDFKRLVWKPGGRQVELTRRWVEDAVSFEATALAEFAGGMEPTMMGPNGAQFTLDFFLADPFFYEESVAFDPDDSGPGFTNRGIDNPRMIIDFIGPLTNPVLTNSTPDPDVYLRLGAVIGGGETITVDVEAGTVFNNDGDNLIGTLSHAGASSWFYIQPGANSIDLDADSGAGSVTINYEIAHL